MELECKVMIEIVADIQRVLMLGCLIGLSVCLFALAVARVLPGVTDAVRRGGIQLGGADTVREVFGDAVPAGCAARRDP